MSAKAIETIGLTKTFPTGGGSVHAVRGLDIQVDRGELVAFLGPNGAGKSTCLRLLTTLLTPTDGTANVCGYEVRERAAEVRARIGHVGQTNGVGPDHRVRDEIVTQGLFHGLSTREALRRTDELSKLLELEHVSQRRVSSLSGGTRRRVDIAMGMVHGPSLLFLDEPSTGLDPRSRANLWRCVLRLREERGTTVFMTTHYLDEADGYAERVMIMDRGRVIADGSPERLKDDLIGDRVVLSFESPARARAAVPWLREYMEGRRDRDIVRRGEEIGLSVPRAGSALPEIVLSLGEKGIVVRGVEIARPTLDDVFLGLTGRSLGEDGGAVPVTRHEGES